MKTTVRPHDNRHWGNAPERVKMLLGVAQDVADEYGETLRIEFGNAMTKSYFTCKITSKCVAIKRTRTGKLRRIWEKTPIAGTGRVVIGRCHWNDKYSDRHLKYIMLHELAHLLDFLKHGKTDGHGPKHQTIEKALVWKHLNATLYYPRARGYATTIRYEGGEVKNLRYGELNSPNPVTPEVYEAARVAYMGE